MKNQQHQSLIFAAVLIALTCSATLLVRIPIPNAQGYVNLGDGILMIGAYILGPVYGFIVGGIGSAMADFFAGYPIYIPITFIVKGIEAMAFGYLIRKWDRPLPIGILCGGLMALGYCIAETFLYGVGPALTALPMNLIQGAFGGLVAFLALKALPESFMQKYRKISH